jgi:hypothetical protein
MKIPYCDFDQSNIYNTDGDAHFRELGGRDGGCWISLSILMLREPVD